MNINQIRKLASLEIGRRYLEDPEVDPAAEVMLYKAASADLGLLEIAGRLPGDILENYEQLGGTFNKEAFGVPMFSAASQGSQAPSTPTMASSVPKPAGTAGLAKGQASNNTGAGIPQIKEPSIPGAAGMGQGKIAAAEIIRPPFRGTDAEKALWLLKQRMKRGLQAASSKPLPGVPAGWRPLDAVGLGRAAMVGAMAGGLGKRVRVARLTPARRKEYKERGGPFTRAALKHPGWYGALGGAVSVPLALRARTWPGAIAGIVGPSAGVAGLDYLLARRERAKAQKDK